MIIVATVFGGDHWPFKSVWHRNRAFPKTNFWNKQVTQHLYGIPAVSKSFGMSLVGLKCTVQTRSIAL
eukprot:2941333-Amphidinium_carterae.1